MAESDNNKIFVFREHSHLIGILANDFESYLPLNRVWVSHNGVDSPFWQYEDKESAKKGYFIHPATLFGFDNISFSQSSVIFFNRQSEDMNVGIIMNDFLMKIVNRKNLNKATAVDLVKNFPPALPKSAFRFIHRFKRKNILILHLEGLMKEYNLSWPETI